MFRVLIYFISLFMLIACQGNNDVEQLKRLYLKQVSLSAIRDANLAADHPKVIVYHDSTQCSTCQLGRISDWDEIIGYLDSLRLYIPVFFIITPPEGQTKEVTRYLDNLGLERYHITLDSLNLFKRHNSFIPDDKSLHTYLLDKNNRILLVGSPLFNDKLWSIYKQVAQQLNENDGELKM